MRAQTINENIFVGKSKEKLTNDIKQKIEDANLIYDAIQDNRMNVKKLKEILDTFPDNLLVGFINRNNDQFTDLGNDDFNMTEGKIVIDGFDGYHSYRSLSKPIPVLEIIKN